MTGPRQGKSVVWLEDFYASFSAAEKCRLSTRAEREERRLRGGTGDKENLNERPGQLRTRGSWDGGVPV